MQKEIDDRMEDNIFSIIHKSQIPKIATVLPVVWQLKIKRDIKVDQIKKYKGRLNIYGSRIKQGIHYDESYAPVETWNTIRMLIIMTAVHKRTTRRLLDKTSQQNNHHKTTR